MSTRRRRPAIFGIAVAALVLAGGGTGIWLMPGTLVAPAQTTLGVPPADLAAESVRIPSASGSTLAGWLARGDVGRGAVLLLHPVRGNRRAMLERARFLRRAGLTVLLVDLQAHGESPGKAITFGARESRDARAALAFLRAHASAERIGALGVSLGGASLLLGPDEAAANLADAVVLEAVYPTIEEAVAARLRIRLGPVGPPLAPLLTWQLQPRLGVRPSELRPIERIDELRVPLLVIAGAADRHTPLEETRRLYGAAPEPKSLWVVEKAGHEDLHARAGAEYEQRLLAFFRQHLQSPS